ncbi:MAG: hypothetical protein ACI90M_002546, partial [Candidatus Azotimanducaceae bacterium]
MTFWWLSCGAATREGGTGKLSKMLSLLTDAQNSDRV